MVWNLDARIPLSPLPDMTALQQALQAGPPAALLLPEGHPSLGGAVATARFQPFASHAVACACCGGRSPVAQALDRLFLARMKGDAPWFDRVVALCPAEDSRAALTAALRDDAVTVSRFRPDARPAPTPPPYKFPPDED